MTETSAIAIIGAGGHAKVVVSVLQAADLPIAGLFDDDPALHGRELLGVRVEGDTGRVRELGLRRGVLGVGDNRVRARLARELGLDWVTAVHPRAWLHETVQLGAGSVVSAGAIVQPDVRIGEQVIVNTGARVDHDCSIGSFAHVAPGATLTGAIRVAEGAFLCAGCTVVRGARIGEWATVAAGATVIGDVAAGTTVRGVPAR